MRQATLAAAAGSAAAELPAETVWRPLYGRSMAASALDGDHQRPLNFAWFFSVCATPCARGDCIVATRALRTPTFGVCSV